MFTRWKRREDTLALGLGSRLNKVYFADSLAPVTQTVSVALVSMRTPPHPHSVIDTLAFGSET